MSANINTSPSIVQSLEQDNDLLIRGICPKAAVTSECSRPVVSPDLSAHDGADLREGISQFLSANFHCPSRCCGPEPSGKLEVAYCSSEQVEADLFLDVYGTRSREREMLLSRRRRSFQSFQLAQKPLGILILKVFLPFSGKKSVEALI